MADKDFEEILIHVCTIQVKTDTGDDAFGQDTFTWGDETTDVKCRLEVTSERQSTENQAAVIQDYNLMLPVATTITEERRVVMTSGTFSGKTFSVQAVNHADDDEGPHHVEAVLDLVKDD